MVVVIDIDHLDAAEADTQNKKKKKCVCGLKVLICCSTLIILFICGIIAIIYYHFKIKSITFNSDILIYLNQNRTDDPLKLVKKVGDGGQGVVFEVRNQNESYAIKTLKNQKECSQEANILRKLNGVKNIPKMYKDLCEQFNSIQMQFIEGKTLYKTKYEYADAWKQIYSIIQDMAQRGVYHNDLFDRNLLKTEDGFWIVDFGRAIFLDFNNSESLQQSPLFTGLPCWWLGANKTPQTLILNELIKGRYKNNISNIQSDEKIIKQLLFEMNGYQVQKEIFAGTLSKQERKEMHLESNKFEHWLKTAEVMRNNTKYVQAHKDHPEEKFLINGIENYAQIYRRAKEIEEPNGKRHHSISD